jgi:hypothetical protein
MRPSPTIYIHNIITSLSLLKYTFNIRLILEESTHFWQRITSTAGSFPSPYERSIKDYYISVSVGHLHSQYSTPSTNLLKECNLELHTIECVPLLLFTLHGTCCDVTHCPTNFFLCPNLLGVALPRFRFRSIAYLLLFIRGYLLHIVTGLMIFIKNI